MLWLALVLTSHEPRGRKEPQTHLLFLMTTWLLAMLVSLLFDCYLTLRQCLGIVVVLVICNGCGINKPHRFLCLHLKGDID